MPSKKSGISEYKLVRIAEESLANAIRLHLDSILLYNNTSFPSAFQLSVIALEEFAKAKWVEHYVFYSGDGYPDEEFEQKWLQLLYRHHRKQFEAIGRDIFSYSPKFAKFVEERQLELKKQNATYVGLSRSKGKVDTSSRISTPKRIKEKDARQQISLLNAELLYICGVIVEQEFFFDIEEMDNVFDDIIMMKLHDWPYKTGLKSRKWLREWNSKRDT